MTITILKALLVIVILAVMAILLLGINQIFSRGYSSDSDARDRLRHDVEERDDVITPDNLFNELVRVKKFRQTI